MDEQTKARRQHIHRHAPWQPCTSVEGMPKFCARCLWRKVNGKARRDAEFIRKARLENDELRKAAARA